MSIGKEAAQKVITPDIARLLLEAIHAGYADWEKHVTAEARATLSSITKANLINDRMVFHAKDKLKAYPNKVEFVLRYGRTHLIIDGVLEIKLKKLSRNLRPFNIPTAAVIRYHNQVVQIPIQPPLFDLPDTLANLIAGYQDTRLHTGIEAVCIIHPQGGLNSWEWRLDFGLTAPLISPVTLLAPTPPRAKLPKKVAPKKRLRKATDKGTRP